MFLNFYDKEADHLFVRLQKINWILTLTDNDIALFVGYKLSMLVMDDKRMVKVEASTYHRHVIWVRSVLTKGFGFELCIFKNFFRRRG